jgi:hypothetical protein
VCLGRLVAASGRPLNFIVRRPKLRLWTLHPKYLDAKGLVALWREGLLARAVLRGATKGYRHHPQLECFRAHASPRAAINICLKAVAIEAEKRGYLFDRQKIGAEGLLSAQLKGDSLMSGSTCCANLKPAVPGCTLGGARRHIRDRTHCLRLSRAASSLGSGSGFRRGRTECARGARVAPLAVLST